MIAFRFEARNCRIAVPVAFQVVPMLIIFAASVTMTEVIRIVILNSFAVHTVTLISRVTLQEFYHPVPSYGINFYVKQNYSGILLKFFHKTNKSKTRGYPL